MATPTKFLIYALGVIAWPVAKLLEFALGPHHGIIYRRAGECFVVWVGGLERVLMFCLRGG